MEKIFNLYQTQSDYNNDTRPNPNISVIKNNEIYYTPTQYRTLTNNDVWEYQQERQHILYSITLTAANVIQPLVLPFDYIITSEDAKHYAFSDIKSISGSGKSLKVTTAVVDDPFPVGYKLLANKPYLYKSDSTQLRLHGIYSKCYQWDSDTIKLIDTIKSQDNQFIYKIYALQKSFKPSVNNTYLSWFTNKTGFGYISTSNTIKPYRWVFTWENNTEAQSNSNNLLMGGLTYNPNAISESDDGDFE